MSKFIFLKSLRELLTPLKRLIDKKAEDVNWNENDSSAPGYIKNRPFYTSDPVLTTIIPETTVTLQDNGGMWRTLLNMSVELQIGKTYVVNWNGTEYTTVCYELDGIPCVGDTSKITGAAPTGEPFVVVSAYSQGMVIVYDWEATSAQDVTFSVLGEKVEIVKIPLEYLPEISSVGKEGTAEGAEIFNNYSDNSASNEYSHAEGNSTTASGYSSHAEGSYSQATSYGAHAEGSWTIASGQYSHAEGYHTIASSDTQHVQGQYNLIDSSKKYAHIVGNGSYSSRKNAHTLDWNGLGWFAGGLKVGGTGQDDVNAVEVALKTDIPSIEGLATESYVDEQFNVLSKQITAPKNSIAFIDQVNGYTYIACMRDGNFVTYCGVKSIKVTTMPSKTKYMVGDYLDPTGMVITATCYDGTTKEITNFNYSSKPMVEGDTFTEITYKEAGIAYTTIVPITVSAFDPTVALVDFEYTANNDGTYTITSWKGTLNGEVSTELIVPNNNLIVV